MIKKIKLFSRLLSILAFTVIFANSCKYDSESITDPLSKPGPNVSDIDGNTYHSVILGTQTWLVENLAVTRYRNGDTIPNVLDTTAWANQTTGAYCNYFNSLGYAANFGKLYNWYSVIDIRNIAPTGWHVPSDSEWVILINYLGGEDIAGGKLKEVGLTHWQNPNTGATNESGMTVLGAGFRDLDGLFYFIKINAGFWSTTEYNTDKAYNRFLYWNTLSIRKYFGDKRMGLSVRCIKDN